MQGYDPADPVCVDRPVEAVLANWTEAIGGLRIAARADISALGATPEALAAMDAVASAVGATETIDIPERATGSQRGLYHHHD